MSYENQAASDHPATIVILVDIGGSTRVPVSTNKNKLDVAKDIFTNLITAMVYRSMKVGVFRPIYRIAVIAYADKLYDIYSGDGSIISINRVAESGIPSLVPQVGRSDLANAFKYAEHFIRNDLMNWPHVWVDACPAPMIINISGCDYSFLGREDPEKYVREIQEISIGDGHVLVENLFITDLISIPAKKISDWTGFQFFESTGDPYCDKLLAMSSPLPESLARLTREQADMNVLKGTAMMYPGDAIGLIKSNFAMPKMS